MYNRFILSLVILFLFTGCSVFNKNKTESSSNKIFKKSNVSLEDRFEKAKLYLSKNKFEKAKNQFQLIIQNDDGSGLSLESHLYIGESFYGLKNYEEAIYHLNYYSMFSNSIENVEKAQFMKTKCTFKMTLGYKNDQSKTFLAISSIQEFLDNFPYSSYKDEAYEMIQNLRERIAKKHFENGRLYLKMKKFDSAMYYFDIVISDYYDTKYSDESKIEYIFTYIVMKQQDKANEYFNANKLTFKSADKLKEAEQILDDYKNGFNISGYYRLYK
tara:strand:- start:317 stop:1132 length:816 start_codon:yes stop_codon:yes gene_type:complete